MDPEHLVLQFKMQGCSLTRFLTQFAQIVLASGGASVKPVLPMYVKSIQNWLVCIVVATRAKYLHPNHTSVLLAKFQAIPIGAKPIHIHL